MNLRINKMTLTNFKGIRERTINFGNHTNINGKNATGKTTLATAYFWLFSNTDYDLKSNPDIYPVGLEEGCPSVEIDMTIDEKPVKMRKTQTRKVTESNGTKKVALTNTYSVNEVPLSERDMQKKLSDMGFDFEKINLLANPNAFISAKKDEQRKILFSMASSLTDLEVALKLENVKESAKLLESYSMDEIRAMQKATLSKINENYGKKGEILVAKIEGLELSKVDLDFAELELLKNSINEKIEKNQDAQRVANQINSELEELHTNDMALQFEYSAIYQKEENEKKEYENQLKQKRREVEEKANDLDRIIRQTKNEVSIYENAVSRYEALAKTFKDAIKEAKALSFNEDSLLCPTCGQLLQFDRQEEIKADFEKRKQAAIERAENDLKENASLLAIKKSELAELGKKLQKAMDDRASLETVLKQPVNALQGHMDEPNPYGDEKDRLQKAISEVQKAIEDKKATMPNMSVLKSEELELQGQLRDCEIQLSKADDNSRIDDKIAELREQQIKYEQQRADSEKILFQLDEIQKAKNELLTEEINKHFKLVRWEMFTYLKNGNYAEACNCFVGDKELGSALNNALQIQAKVDICNGLQNFFDKHLPIWIDNSEALDTENQDHVKADTQIIMLRVTDDKELTVKEI